MNILISFLLISGLFFFIVGTIGILRFPDIYTRAHSTAKCDTLGTVLILLALIIYNGLNFVSLKILLIIIFIWITSPTSTHLIAKANYIQEENKDKKIIKN